MIISGAPPAARWHVLASHVWLHGCAPARSAPCCASTPRISLAMGVVAPQVDRPEVAAATSLHLWRVLTHQFGEASAGIGGEIGAQAVPGVAFGVDWPIRHDRLRVRLPHTRRRRAAPSAIGCTGADRDGEGFPSKP